MRFLVVFAVFCTFLVVLPAQGSAEVSFMQKKHKYWWEDGYNSGVSAPYSGGGSDLGGASRSSRASGSSSGSWANRDTGYKKDIKHGYRSTKKFLFGIPGDDNTAAYFTDPDGPQNVYYEQDGWTPQVWADNRGGARAVIDDFYDAGVITDQYNNDGVPILEVGQPFLDLSFQDQRRVAAYVDYAFNMTQSSGVYKIVFDNWYQTPVGVYTKEGLKLQEK